MAIKLLVEVTIDGFKAEPSEKGNFTARGVFAEVKKATGATAEQLKVFAPSYGNAGSVLFMTTDPGLVKKVNAAAKRPDKKTPALPKALQGLSEEKLAKLIALLDDE
jgi:hypothetical protein